MLSQGFHAGAAAHKGMGDKIKGPPKLIGKRKIVGKAFFIKSSAMEHMQGGFGKVDLDGCFPCLYLVFYQLIKIIPEFMEDIKKEDNGNDFPVLAFIGIDIGAPLFFKHTDSMPDFLDGLIYPFPPGGRRKKPCNLDVQLFS